MKTLYLFCSLLSACALLPSCTTNDPVTGMIAANSSARKINSDSRAALAHLYSTNPRARKLGSRAKGVLVFPNVTKAGFIVGGQVGQGALFRSDRQTAYYQTTAVSYGLQAGAQKFGYALFLMNDDSLRQLYKSGGWEVGGSPSLVVIDEGISGSLTTTTMKSGTYAVFFNQRGLMAGLGLQGTKITQISPEP